MEKYIPTLTDVNALTIDVIEVDGQPPVCFAIRRNHDEPKRRRGRIPGNRSRARFSTSAVAENDRGTGIQFQPDCARKHDETHFPTQFHKEGRTGEPKTGSRDDQCAEKYVWSRLKSIKRQFPAFTSQHHGDPATVKNRTRRYKTQWDREGEKMMVYIREHDHSEGSLWANNGDVRPCRYKLLGQSLPPRLQRAIKCDQVISVANQTADRKTKAIACGEDVPGITLPIQLVSAKAVTSIVKVSATWLVAAERQPEGCRNCLFGSHIRHAMLHLNLTRSANYIYELSPIKQITLRVEGNK
ncbi:hypothetical protein EAG_06486 [Camponotus floridanus]|uniref:Uncharacterized protein n=1 Tax=Camponotus floridanus TaxID=104421 RepID=E1ZYE5_CAMFO|nr:hypothetical protein EAG_06486 [Camponotus floridanus]